MGGAPWDTSHVSLVGTGLLLAKDGGRVYQPTSPCLGKEELFRIEPRMNREERFVQMLFLQPFPQLSETPTKWFNDARRG